MELSHHAAQRWSERFPSHDVAAEFAAARRASKKTKQQIRRQCPGLFKPNYMERGIYYLRSPANAIFVVARGEYVVTVFPLGDKHKGAQ